MDNLVHSFALALLALSLARLTFWQYRALLARRRTGAAAAAGGHRSVDRTDRMAR